EAAVGAVETRLVWILHGGSGEVTLRVFHVNAMRPRVVREEREQRRAVLDRGDQAVVVGRSRVGDEDRSSSSAGELRAFLRILQNQAEALAVVRGRRAA